ncbi:MAG: type III pantothenate kinase, partial [Deltaproteobacteria bacterium]|nr:type III pantothenate kinase [Deltaproteobacteria bacterium]
MLLVIDVGNTNTVLGVYDGDVLVHDWRIRTVIDHTVDEYGMLIYSLYKSSNISSKQIDDIIISCVVPPMLNILETVCLKYFQTTPLIVGPGVKTGMPIFYDNPREIGADRIVNAVAAYERCRRDLIVVDFGTAMSFDYISPRGEY